MISERHNQALKHQVQIAQAQGDLVDAKSKTEEARYKKKQKVELEKK